LDRESSFHNINIFDLLKEVNMKKLTDSELIEELDKRFKENEKAFNALRIMTKKLENLNNKLQDSETLKSNFLSNIKNEINNPLTSILLMSKELTSGAPLEAETLSSLGRMIHSEAFSLNSQLRNIFAAAEFEAGDATLCVSRINVDSLIKNTIESLQHKADRKIVKVQYTPAGGSENNTSFNSDPDKLHLIIFNILGNAIEFSNEGGQVELMSWKQDRNLYISVKDYGTGIDRTEQDKIFDRFRQLDTGVTKNHLGHGLGLSVVKAAVEILNGTMSVESEKEKGCTFTVSIPEGAEEPELGIVSDDGNEFIFEGAEEF
jgi:signal transduction histidine kinase